ncbi:MAG: hypothetical protein LBM02_09185 [Lachnospiraceae bacterium]|jgi:hypothetical protein|nr:hypothetical protein [Lachnospiraceae bacterium]
MSRYRYAAGHSMRIRKDKKTIVIIIVACILFLLSLSTILGSLGYSASGGDLKILSSGTIRPVPELTVFVGSGREGWPFGGCTMAPSSGIKITSMSADMNYVYIGGSRFNNTPSRLYTGCYLRIKNVGNINYKFTGVTLLNAGTLDVNKCSIKLLTGSFPSPGVGTFVTENVVLKPNEYQVIYINIDINDVSPPNSDVKFLVRIDGYRA